MIGFLIGWEAVVENALLYSGLALSQYILLRAGIFSVATVAFAALGAYAAAIATLSYAAPAPLGVLIGCLVGMVSGACLFLPLARLRGVFQAIASFSFVQIVQSLLYYSESVTGGSGGLNGIPKTVGLGTVIVWVAVASAFLVLLARCSVGRALDAIRQDETVAVSLGINVRKLHLAAFVISGGLAGTTGALLAYHDYSLMPETFGFGLLVDVLAFAVLGGFLSVLGPIVGAFVLLALPEIFRVFAEYRLVLMGVLLIGVMIYLPHGIVDTIGLALRSRSRRSAGRLQSTTTGVRP